MGFTCDGDISMWMRSGIVVTRDLPASVRLVTL